MSDAHALELASMDRGRKSSRFNPELTKLPSTGAKQPERGEGIDGVHAPKDGRSSSSPR